MRTYSPSPSILAPEIPLYQLGYLGQGIQALRFGGQIGGKVASGLLATTSWAAAAGPIGAAIAIGVGLIAGLISAHNLRKKQAQDENSAMNIGVQGFDADLRAIHDAYTSGQADQATAIQAVELALQNYWDLVTPHIQPGRNGCNGGGSCPGWQVDGRTYCQGNIGAACCAGCAVLYPSVYRPDGVLAALKGQSSWPYGSPEDPGQQFSKYTAEIQEIFGSKYGGLQRLPYQLTFKPPAPAPTATPGTPAPAGSAAASAPAAASSIAQQAESLAAAKVFGIPVWMLAVGAGLLLLGEEN